MFKLGHIFHNVYKLDPGTNALYIMNMNNISLIIDFTTGHCNGRSLQYQVLT